MASYLQDFRNFTSVLPNDVYYVLLGSPHFEHGEEPPGRFYEESAGAVKLSQ